MEAPLSPRRDFPSKKDEAIHNELVNRVQELNLSRESLKDLIGDLKTDLQDAKKELQGFILKNSILEQENLSLQKVITDFIERLEPQALPSRPTSPRPNATPSAVVPGKNTLLANIIKEHMDHLQDQEKKIQILENYKDNIHIIKTMQEKLDIKTTDLAKVKADFKQYRTIADKLNVEIDKLKVRYSELENLKEEAKFQTLVVREKDRLLQQAEMELAQAQDLIQKLQQSEYSKSTEEVSSARVIALEHALNEKILLIEEKEKQLQAFEQELRSNREVIAMLSQGIELTKLNQLVQEQEFTNMREQLLEQLSEKDTVINQLKEDNKRVRAMLEKRFSDPSKSDKTSTTSVEQILDHLEETVQHFDPVSALQEKQEKMEKLLAQLQEKESDKQLLHIAASRLQDKKKLLKQRLESQKLHSQSLTKLVDSKTKQTSQLQTVVNDLEDRLKQRDEQLSTLSKKYTTDVEALRAENESQKKSLERLMQLLNGTHDTKREEIAAMEAVHKEEIVKLQKQVEAASDLATKEKKKARLLMEENMELTQELDNLQQKASAKNDKPEEKEEHNEATEVVPDDE